MLQSVGYKGRQVLLYYYCIIIGFESVYFCPIANLGSECATLVTLWMLQIQKLRHRETKQRAQGNGKSVGDLGIDPRCPEFSILTTRPSFLSFG